jgi:hypothetical protein
MTPAGARLLFTRLDLTVQKAAVLFGRSVRCVFYWLDDERDGPPEHVALALTELMEGRLSKHPSAVRAFIRKAYTRRDGDRYRREK